MRENLVLEGSKTPDGEGSDSIGDGGGGLRKMEFGLALGSVMKTTLA